MTAAESVAPLPQWSLGERMEKARKHAGLTRDEMADRIGISRNTVINYETDKTHPTDRRLRLWALTTGVPESWLRGSESFHGNRPNTKSPPFGPAAGAVRHLRAV